MPKHLRAILLASIVFPLAGCGLVYKPVISQGNLLMSKQVNQLKTGMTKSQVLALLGTPAITSPFDHNRWDYISTTRVPGKPVVEHKLSLYFQYGALVRTVGKYFGQSAENEQQLLKQAKKYHVEAPDKGPRGDKNHGGDSGDGS